MHRRLTVAILAMALLAPLAPRAHAGSMTLTYSNFFPPTHIMSKLAESWCKEVEKRTEGRVTIQYFPGSTLTKGPQIYDGVANGISDVGMSLFAYTRGRFPVMEAVDLPLGYPSGKVASAVINEVYHTLRPKELDDVQVMYLHAHGPGIIHSVKKPINKLEDLKGMKIRATGFSAKMVKALGGTPVAMPMPATYQALSKGVVDGATFPYEAGKGFRLFEITKYSTDSQAIAYTSGFFIVMNKNKWNAISAADRAAIQKINDKWATETAETWDKIDVKGRAYLKEKGGRSVTLAPEEVERWKAAVAPVLDEYVASANKRGVDGKKALEVTKAALTKYTKMYGEK